MGEHFITRMQKEKWVEQNKHLFDDLTKTDEVQTFIARNQHQFGYIMQEASRQWIGKDPVGALTVGDCNFVIQKHGQYHELLEKVERYEKALRRIASDESITFEQTEIIAKRALKEPPFNK